MQAAVPFTVNPAAVGITTGFKRLRSTVCFEGVPQGSVLAPLMFQT